MANETSGRRDNRVPFRASTKTPNIMMLRRTRLLLIVCGILAFAVLGIKLFSVMIIHHDEYEKMAIDQQVRETEITASRGAIYDTNGKILAMNASVDTIFISPAEIAKNNEDPQLIARELSEILDVDYDKILSMTKNTDRWYEVVKRKVEPDVSEKVRAFKKENKLIGVKIEPDTKRYYPYGSLAAHVIGFVGQDNEGRYGLEQRYDSYLHRQHRPHHPRNGQPRHGYALCQLRGLLRRDEGQRHEPDHRRHHPVLSRKAPAAGGRGLRRAKRRGGHLPWTRARGAILGMVSLGNFDLNDYQKVSDKDQEAIDAETDPDKTLGAADCRAAEAVAQQGPLGHLRARLDVQDHHAGHGARGGRGQREFVVLLRRQHERARAVPTPVKCWKTAGHGSQTLTQAMQHSCNVALVQIGQLVGARTFYKYAEAFGFLNLTNNVDSSLTGQDRHRPRPARAAASGGARTRSTTRRTSRQLAAASLRPDV